MRPVGGTSFLPGSYRLLIPLLVGGVLFHSLARVVFYLWNLQNFAGVSTWDLLRAFLWGLRFDVSVTALFLLPGVLFVVLLGLFAYERWLRWLVFLSFVILLVPALTLNFIDTEMINFVGRRFAWQTLFLFREAEGKAGGFLSTYAPAILAGLMILISVVWLTWKWMFVWGGRSLARAGILKHLAFGLLFSILLVVGVRGGLQSKPLSFVHSQLFNESWLNQLVMNSSFSVIRSARQKPLERLTFFDDPAEKLRYLNATVLGPSALEGKRLPKLQNVVIIILESFGLEYMGKINGDAGHTPFLDSLAEKSLFFPRAIANGRRSIEGVPAILTGVPTLTDEPFIASPFAANEILRLPAVLKSQNYHTSFFHGGNNGTMYLDSFARGIGIDHYFGAREYPNKEDHDGTWGIYDEPFFQYFADQVSTFRQPFFATFFSLSSHQPYKIPDHLKDRFRAGPLPILSAISYTDESLKKFFAKAESQPWFNNTLFILTADHTQMSYRAAYQNDVSKYKIPILIYHPSFEWPAVDNDAIVQQIDIPATVLDFLGLEPPEEMPLTGSAFRRGDRVAVTYLDGRYFLIAKDYFLVWSPAIGGEMKMYASQDAAQIQALQEPAIRKSLLEKKMKGALEYFTEGMLDNRLLVKARSSK